MIRARACAVVALFLQGVFVMIVISSAAFSQTIPTNWEVRYLNLKDNLRALAVDPLDPKIVLIGSDLAVMGTSDGGQTWTAGESFRTASFSISGAVGPEIEELLLMIEESSGGEAAAGGAGQREEEQEGLQEAQLALEEQLRDTEETVAATAESVVELESELQQAQQAAEEAEIRLGDAEGAVSSRIEESISIADVEAAEFDELEEWLEERGLSVRDELEARQDDLKAYLEEYEDEGEALRVELAEALVERDETVARVDELENQLAAAAAAAAEAAEIQSETELDLTFQEEAAADLPAGEAGRSAAAGGGADLDLQATGVTYLAFDPASSEKVYLAAFDGVYKSADGARTWEKIYTGPNPPQSASICLAIDPSNPDSIFVGTISGIAHSADGGETWERPGGRIANMAVTRIVVHPFDSRIVLAATVGYGVFKSADGGGEWVQVFNRAGAGANRVLSLEFAPSQPEIIYAGTMSGIYKSLDSGESWDPATGMGISSAIQIRDLVVSPINPDQVLIAAGRGVFGTVNGGKLWRRLAFGTIYEGAKFLSFDPLNPGTIWLLTGSRVVQSVGACFIDLSGGQAQPLAGCGEITLDGQEKHTIVIDEIDEEGGWVTITIQSDPRTVQIKVGETAAVDLSGDGRDDLSLTLESLEGGVPLFNLARIAPSATVAVEENADTLVPPDRITGLEDLEPYFRTEPTWVEVQQAASRWAEVHPEKIAAWRSGASFRALLPRLNLDFSQQNRRREDFDQVEQDSYSLDYYQRDRGETNLSRDEGQQFQTAYTAGLIELYRTDYEQDREQQRRYEEFRITTRDSERLQDTATSQNLSSDIWGLSLRWDLGDFLYSTDQLRISTEARRLVELRQDVVEQVTLYYFDRRTARIDMILNPPADPYSRVEMLLQIQQLDASLDAMTGGYFTQTIKQRELRRRR